MPRHTLTTLAALLLAAMLSVAPADAARGSRLGPAERYELGLKYMKRGYYTKALEQFNRVRNYHRDDPHATLAEPSIRLMRLHGVLAPSPPGP